MKTRRYVAALVSGLIGALALAPALAQTQVDVELALAVDVSRSMGEEERLLQRDGYVSAFRHPDIHQAIASGLIGRIAVTYFEWAGPGRTRIVVPWTLIGSAAEARAFADALSATPPQPARGTSISGGLDFARTLIDGNDVDGLRKIIDVSGDGPNNIGRPVTTARDETVAEGIVVNGLAIEHGLRLYGYFDIPDLDRYYQDCVIGGPGAFVISVDDIAEFEIAIRRKLVLEIAGLRPDPVPRLVPVQLDQGEPTDCMIGEKMRARRYQFEYEN